MPWRGSWWYKALIPSSPPPLSSPTPIKPHCPRAPTVTDRWHEPDTGDCLRGESVPQRRSMPAVVQDGLSCVFSYLLACSDGLGSPCSVVFWQAGNVTVKPSLWVRTAGSGDETRWEARRSTQTPPLAFKPCHHISSCEQDCLGLPRAIKQVKFDFAWTHWKRSLSLVCAH